MRLRRLGWRFQDPQSQIAYILIKRRGEYAVPIMQEKTVTMVSWGRLTELLQRPRCRGVDSHIHVYDRRVACSITTKT